MLVSDGAFPKSHAGVLHEFGRRYVQGGVVPASLHSHLARLEAKRNAADYGSAVVLGAADAAAAIAVAKALIETAPRYLARG